MATPIAMPRQGQSVETCVITEWHKQKGDQVSEGEPLFSYETDKASFDFESPVGGTLLEIFFPTDADVPVLENVAVIGSQGEDVSSFSPSGTGSPAGESAPAKAEPAPAPAAPAPAAATAPQQTQPTVEPAPPESSPEGPLRVSPRARRRAEERRVSLDGMSGSGPMGRIIERDVIARQGRVEEIPAAAPLTAAAPAPAPATDDRAVSEVVKVSNMRKIIGQRMMESLQQSAQLTMQASANATGLLALRAAVKKHGETMGLANINITDMIAYALVQTLKEFPELNATFADNVLTRYRVVHLALAVDTPRGLVVPVIRCADALSLDGLARRLKEMAGQARDGAVNPDLLSGGTVTLTNLGNFGIEAFTPVINRPQVAILGVTTISPKPVMKDTGECAMEPHIGLSLTIDHQVVDGAPAARFMQTLVRKIEQITLTLTR